MERNRKSAAPNTKQKGVFASALIGGGIGLALILMLALLSPFALLGFSNPNATVLPVTAVCVFLGGISGATVSAKSCKSSPLAAGMLSAGVIALPLMLASFFISGDWSVIALGVMPASLVASSLVGAWLTAKAGRSQRRNMKKALKRR